MLSGSAPSTASTVAGTASSTTRCTSSRSLAQRDPATKEYLARKEAEGKTRKGALRSLKRHLARRFYHLLAEAPADQQQAADSEPIVESALPAVPPRSYPEREIQQVGTAPFPMVCIS